MLGKCWSGGFLYFVRSLKLGQDLHAILFSVQVLDFISLWYILEIRGPQ